MSGTRSRSIGYGHCVDCACTVVLSKHGACGQCGGNSIAPRRRVQPLEYEPEEQTRLALNVETTPDVFVPGQA